jgi:hypothetical protein
MSGTASDSEPGESNDGYQRSPFLATHRAAGAHTRQFAHLCDALVQGASRLHSGSAPAAPVVRQSPGRCILQLGPVAITVTWIKRNLGSIGDGELLVIVWRGGVAPKREYCPERAPATRPSSSATVLWEQSLRPVAASESTWVWQAGDGDRVGYSSVDLAALCVEQLRLASEACEVADASGLGASDASTGDDDPLLPRRRNARVA